MQPKKCTHQSPPGKCRATCAHRNRCGYCGKCGDKPPRGENLHACRCGRFIDKSVNVCHKCLEVGSSVYGDIPHREHRHTMREVIYQLNDRAY